MSIAAYQVGGEDIKETFGAVRELAAGNYLFCQTSDSGCGRSNDRGGRARAWELF